MSRDWQKDVELCERAVKTESGLTEFTEPHNGPEMTIYWLQQYAAEKERGDKAEEREKILKHAFIVMLGYVPKTARMALDFDEVLASLYPKEETKPAVLEEGEG